MPELRKDPIVGRWVIIATERARRPVEYTPDRALPRGGVCPFCHGQEDKTPRAVLTYQTSGHVAGPLDAKDWTLRVVPNKYPALMIEGGLDRAGDGLYDMMNGVGAHEVVIETPHHDQDLADLPVADVENVLWALRDRIVDLKRDKRFRYVMAFKNHGMAAGATLEHSHSQLVALPIVPRVVAEELAGARQHFELKERCIFCDILRQERLDGRRVVYENPGCMVLAPWAPRFPFETWVLPKTHGARFEDADGDTLRFLADALRTALRKINVALDNPPFNFMLHSAPFQDRDVDSYHWHFEIMPTLTRAAGFEWGSGFSINPTPPEDAAAFLRDIRE
jgi:UDPglucose--hexose-1-phosphate uridylyltransferase